MRFYENEQGKYRDGDIAEKVIKKDRKNYLEIRPFNLTTVSYIWDHSCEEKRTRILCLKQYEDTSYHDFIKHSKLSKGVRG